MIRHTTAIRVLAYISAASLIMQGKLVVNVGGLGLSLHRVVFIFVCFSSGALGPHGNRGVRAARQLAASWFVLCTFVLIWHPLRQASVATFLNYSLDGVLITFLVGSRWGRYFIHQVIRALLWLTVVMCVVAILELVNGRYLVPDGLVAFRTRLRHGQIRGQGLFPHPLVLGVTAAALLIGPARQMASRSTARVLQCLLLAGVLATQSRGPLLMIVAAAAVWVAGSASTRARWVWPVLVTVLVLAFFAQTDTSTVRQNSSEEATSTAYRSLLLKVTQRVAITRPTGVGFGELAGGVDSGELLTRFGGVQVDVGRTVDNDFAIVVIYGGALLGVGYAALFVAAARSLGRRRRDRQQSGQLAMLAAQAVAACFIASLSWPILSFLVWANVATAIAGRPDEVRANGLDKFGKITT